MQLRAGQLDNERCQFRRQAARHFEFSAQLPPDGRLNLRYQFCRANLMVRDADSHECKLWRRQMITGGTRANDEKYDHYCDPFPMAGKAPPSFEG
jgi:hypothetical protein